MTTSHEVAEAKAQLSRVLDEVLAGEDVVLARAGVPVARLVPVTPDDRFDPLDDEDLAAWS